MSDAKPRTLNQIGASVAALRTQNPLACHHIGRAAVALAGKKASRKKGAQSLAAAADLPGGHRDQAAALLAELGA